MDLVVQAKGRGSCTVQIPAASAAGGGGRGGGGGAGLAISGPSSIVLEEEAVVSEMMTAMRWRLKGVRVAILLIIGEA